MSLSTTSGTGLKPIASPTGLKISSSPFTSQPDTEVMAVDVYTVQNTGVINSIKEDTGESDSFFDKIKNAFSNGVSAVTGGLTAAGGIGGALNTLRSGTNLLKQVTNVASRAMSAVNQIQKGGVMGTISGLSTLGGMSGFQGASQLANTGRGIIGGIAQGGVTGYLRAGSAALGNQGLALGQLAGNIGTITRAASYMKSAISSGNISAVLSGVDYSLAATSSTLATLDRASQINFQSGFDSVLNKTAINAKSFNKSSVGVVHTAVNDFTSGFADETVSYSVPVRAGAVTGLAFTGSALGDDSIYSLVRSKGLDDDSAFIAGSAISSYGARTGNLNLLKDVSSDPVGCKAVSSNPSALYKTVSSLTPNQSQMRKSHASVFDDISSLGNTLGQKWNSVQRNGGEITDITAAMGSQYALQVVQGKASVDDFNARRAQTTINSLTTSLSKAQLMSAAASAVPSTVQSLLTTNPRMSSSEARQIVGDTMTA